MRFDYSSDFFPPGLIFPIAVFPLVGKDGITIDAKIDTGADMSAIPERLIEILELTPSGVIYAQGAVDVEVKKLPTYYVKLSLNEEFNFELEIISTHRKNFLIGRDVLNQVILIANGPEEYFEIK